MPKMKTHKGLKKRFKVTATGKVMHKPCGSSHLNSHKNGKKIRNLRRKKALKVSAESARIRKAIRERESTSPAAAEAEAVLRLKASEAASALEASPAEESAAN